MSSNEVQVEGRTLSGVPVWFLDVDGVINDWRDGAWEGEPRDDHESILATVGPGITCHRSVVDRIVRLHESGVVQVVWLTNWLDRANGLAGGLGFSTHLAVAGHPEYRRVTTSWWKLVAVQRWMADHAGRRVVWADDDLVDTEAQVWLRERDDVLAVCPEYHLTHEHLDEIEAWLHAPTDLVALTGGGASS